MNFSKPTPRIVGALCLLFACLLIAPAVRAATNTIIFDLGNFGADAVSYKQVRIAPSRSSFPRVEGQTVRGIDYGFKLTDANGRLTNQMVTGTYDITFTNRFLATTFQITAPETNSIDALYASDLTTAGTNLPSNLVAYSQSAANSLFLRAFQISTNGVKVGSGFTNVDFTTGVTGYVSGSTIRLGVTATGGSGDAGGTNSRQGGSLNLTNWSNIPTGAMANIPAVTFLTNWTTAISNYVDTASSNRVRLAGGAGGITVSQSGSGGVQTWTINDDDAGSGGSDAGGTNARQFGTLVLTNLSNTASNNVDYVTALTTLTNVANTASNRTWTADDYFTNRSAAHLTALTTLTNTINTASNRVTVLEGMTNSFQSGTNFAGLNLTNALKRAWVHQGANTNQTIDWSKTNHVILQPSNTVTIAFANTPAAGSLAQELRLEIYNTNASGVTVVFPSSVDWGSNASPVYLAGTNHYVFRFNGTNLYGFSGQVLTTGSGETNVLSVSPALVTPTINGQTIAAGTSILTNPHAFQPPSLNLTNWSLIPTGAMANIPAVTFLTNWANAVSNLAASAVGGGILTNSGSGTNNTFTNPTNHGTVTVKGAGNSRIFFEDTNTALSVSFQAAMETIRSNLNFYLPTNGMGGNNAGILIATNTGGGTNAQTTIAAIGSGLSLSSDGKTLSATASGSSSFNSTNLYVSNSAVVVADLANFDRLKVYAISNGTIHLSNASSFLRRGRALIQQSTNGLASIAWSVPGGLLQTNVNIGNNTNANALDVLEFEQSFFETNLFAWWPSNFLPRVAFTNSLAGGGGGGGDDFRTGLIFDLDVDGLSGSDGDAMTTFPDASGNAHHFSADTSGWRPALTNSTAGFNNKKSLWFDGASDMLTNKTYSTIAQNYTYFAVIRLKDTYGNFANQYLLDDTSGTAEFSIRAVDTANYKFSVYDGALREFAILSADPPPTTPFVISVVMDSTGTALKVYTNGVQMASATAWAQPVGNYLTLGAVQGGGTGHFNGIMADQRLYTGALADADRKTVEQFLGTKFGITVAP